MCRGFECTFSTRLEHEGVLLAVNNFRRDRFLEIQLTCVSILEFRIILALGLALIKSGSCRLGARSSRFESQRDLTQGVGPSKTPA